jgi:hypothetical protein
MSSQPDFFGMPGFRQRILATRAVLTGGPFIARWSLHSGFRYEDAKARYQPFNRLIDEDPDGRMALAEECQSAAQAGQPAFVIINNKAEGSAPLSIGKLAAAMAERPSGTHLAQENR